ncbi:MAG: AAA family ATPase [Sphingosinicella sp.]|uniref:AAA family ATPase n=1 Tax=Sphingosinicella sp. TaxID=1917971 RepID=UPI004037D89F
MARITRRPSRRPSESGNPHLDGRASVTPRPPLKSLTIRGLFGRFDFPTIPLCHGGEAPRLTLLYGENGVGKTTILNLIYALLSDERNRGRRGYRLNIRDHETITYYLAFARKIYGLRDVTEAEVWRHLVREIIRSRLCPEFNRISDHARAISGTA